MFRRLSNQTMERWRHDKDASLFSTKSEFCPWHMSHFLLAALPHIIPPLLPPFCVQKCSILAASFPKSHHYLMAGSSIGFVFHCPEERVLQNPRESVTYPPPYYLLFFPKFPEDTYAHMQEERERESIPQRGVLMSLFLFLRFSIPCV